MIFNFIIDKRNVINYVKITFGQIYTFWKNMFANNSYTPVLFYQRLLNSIYFFSLFNLVVHIRAIFTCIFKRLSL